MTYNACPVFDGYIPLWLEFAGDDELLEEIMEHKVSCPICLANMLEAEHGTKIEPEPQDELLPVERRNLGEWLDQEAVRIGAIERD